MQRKFDADMKSYQEAKKLGIEDDIVLATIKYDPEWMSLMNDICEKIEFFANEDNCAIAFDRELIDNYKRAHDYMNDSIKFKEVCLKLGYMKRHPNFEQISDFLNRRIVFLKIALERGEKLYALKGTQEFLSMEKLRNMGVI